MCRGRACKKAHNTALCAVNTYVSTSWVQKQTSINTIHSTQTHTHSSEWRKEPCFSLECTPPNMLDYTRTGLPRPHRPVNMNSSPSARRVRMEPFLYPNIFLTLRDRGRNQHTHAASSLVMSCRTFHASAVLNADSSTTEANMYSVIDATKN